MENNSITVAAIKTVQGGIATDSNDLLAAEEPLEIRIAYNTPSGYVQKNVSVTMRTPGNDENLAAGFLFTEGIVKTASEIKGITHTGFDKNVLLVTMVGNATPYLQNSERNFYTTSSCGVCGKASIDAIKTIKAGIAVHDDLQINAEVFCTLEKKLRQQQAVFESTGGLHASARFDTGGRFLLLREDVGRHNALDKLIGAVLLNNPEVFANAILLLSGRISFELVQKAAMAGIKIIAAIGAPSSLAVELAKECGITLVGFLRGTRFNIYSAPQRVKL